MKVIYSGLSEVKDGEPVEIQNLHPRAIIGIMKDNVKCSLFSAVGTL
jgi:hypothetical protein